MNCVDVEILLAEYVDGTLHADTKSAVEQHLASCAACGELARDAAEAVALMDRSAEVEAPPELVTRILFEVTQGSSRQVVKPPLARRLFGPMLGSWLEPVLQPRFAMGMATTLLSLAMLIHGRQLRPADLDPVKLWTEAGNQIGRTWERGVKYYENLRLVFEIQTRLNQWNDETAAAANRTPPNQGSPQEKGSTQEKGPPQENRK